MATINQLGKLNFRK